MADLKFELAKRYENCVCYRDEGAVRLVDPAENDQPIILFKTSFRRNRHFRFEWTYHKYPDKNEPEQNFIEFDGKNAFLTYHGQPPVAEDSLALAVAKVTGVSMGTAHHIPSLLMPEIALRSRSLIRGSYSDVSDASDRMHYHLDRERNGKRTELWIRRADFVLEKVMITRVGLEAFDRLQQVIQNGLHNKSAPQI